MERNDRSLFFVGGTLQQGGAERIISVLSSKFLSHFSVIKIILWKESDIFYDIVNNIEVISIPKKSGRRSLLGQMLWFRQYVKQKRPFAVLSFLAPFNMLSLVSLYGLKNPIYIANRSDPLYDAPNKYWRWLRDIIYHLADGISVQSEVNKHYFSHKLQKKITVIPNPVFIGTELIGSALKTPKQAMIVSVGRLDKVKNQILLFEAFSEIHEKYPEYHLVIYGEGNYRHELETKIQDLHLEAFISLPGACKDVLQKIRSAEIFVMTSNYEGMSNALIEAMALGLPIISTKVSGAIDLVKNDVNGKLISIGSKEELKVALKDWLDNKDKARNCGKQATLLFNQLDLDTIVKRWLEFVHA